MAKLSAMQKRGSSFDNILLGGYSISLARWVSWPRVCPALVKKRGKADAIADCGRPVQSIAAKLDRSAVHIPPGMAADHKIVVNQWLEKLRVDAVERIASNGARRLADFWALRCDWRIMSNFAPRCLIGADRNGFTAARRGFGADMAGGASPFSRALTGSMGVAYAADQIFKKIQKKHLYFECNQTDIAQRQNLNRSLGSGVALFFTQKILCANAQFRKAGGDLIGFIKKHWKSCAVDLNILAGRIVFCQMK